MAKRSHLLAWNGWMLSMPDSWHPLRVEGDYRRGRMSLGDGERALLQINWLRPRVPFFRPDNWLARKVREYATARTPEFFVDAERGIARGVMLPDLTFSRDDVRSICYAISGKNLVVEMTSNGAATERERALIEKTCFPSLRFSAEDQPTPWSIFETRFETPPGFMLRRFSLLLGDISLELVSSRRERLIVRQVYPGKLALTRRSLEPWLENPPFPRSLRESSSELIHPFGIPGGIDGGEFCFRASQRSLRKPLHMFGRRLCFAAAQLDRRRDRLYIAELELKDARRADLLQEVMIAMALDGRKGSGR